MSSKGNSTNNDQLVGLLGMCTLAFSEYAASCFEHEDSLSTLSAACQYIVESQHVNSHPHLSKLITTEILEPDYISHSVYATCTTCPVTTMVSYGHSYTARTRAETSRVTQTATLTIYSDCTRLTTTASSQIFSPIPTRSQHPYYIITTANLHLMRPSEGVL